MRVSRGVAVLILMILFITSTALGEGGALLVGWQPIRPDLCASPARAAAHDLVITIVGVVAAQDIHRFHVRGASAVFLLFDRLKP